MKILIQTTWVGPEMLHFKPAPRLCVYCWSMDHTLSSKGLAWLNWVTVVGRFLSWGDWILVLDKKFLNHLCIAFYAEYQITTNLAPSNHTPFISQFFVGQVSGNSMTFFAQVLRSLNHGVSQAKFSSGAQGSCPSSFRWSQNSVSCSWRTEVPVSWLLWTGPTLSS